MNDVFIDTKIDEPVAYSVRGIPKIISVKIRL